MSRWSYLLEGLEDKIKKVKALADRPGMEGEGKAARKAVERLRAKKKTRKAKKTKKIKAVSKKRFVKIRLPGHGGMDYTSYNDWDHLLDNAKRQSKRLLIRFVLDYPGVTSSSRWKIVDKVKLRSDGTTVLSVRDLKGSNREDKVMTREKLGKYVVEVKMDKIAGKGLIGEV